MRRLLVLVLLALPLAACGSDDDPTPQATAEEDNGGPDFCDGMADAAALVESSGEQELAGGSTPADLVQLVRDTADVFASLEAPEAIADAFERYAETTAGMADVLEAAGDDPEAMGAAAETYVNEHLDEQPQLDEVAAYVTDECGVPFDDVTGVHAAGP